jgi:hypothetical protein
MSHPAQGHYPPPPPKAKISPVVWILIGIGGFILLAGITVMAVGVYVVKRVADNPLDAAATMIAAANPDVEVVSKDPGRGVVTFREKSTGKTVTVDLEHIKQGRLSFASDDKEVHVEAGEGGVRVKSSDGETAVLGAGPVKLPSWMPSYPGARLEGRLSAMKNDKESTMAGFTTRDSFRQVLDFYSDAFEKNGLTVERTIISDTTAVLHAKAEAPRRSAVVNITSGTDGTNVNLFFSEQE